MKRKPYLGSDMAIRILQDGRRKWQCRRGSSEFDLQNFLTSGFHENGREEFYIRFHLHKHIIRTLHEHEDFVEENIRENERQNHLEFV